MEQSEFLHFDVTGKIIGAVHRVYSKLGTGFPREFYQNALNHELTKDAQVSCNHPVVMSYDAAVVGEWRADLLVDDKVIVIIAADETLNGSLDATLLNVLKASRFEVGFVVNFGRKLEFHRRVHSAGAGVRRAGAK